MLNDLIKELYKIRNPKKAKELQKFFKTGKGEYGEGDVFLGINVPTQRQMATKYKNLSLGEIQKLLSNKIHEFRLVGLLISIEKYNKSSQKEKKIIVNLYLKNTKNINNWDLVDLSSHKILGDYLSNKDKSLLYKLAQSKNLWEKRIAIISTYTFIKNKEFTDSIKIAKILLQDKRDLIHKAVGWMLREVGKKDINVLSNFLNKHYKTMPRTTLRYAIERLDKKKKEFYMKK
ncbi:MAG: DNA alkylation repair protein [bacterium]